MKKSRIYRIGSALLAAVMVATCMPQTGLYVQAEELVSPADADEEKTGVPAQSPAEEQTPQPETEIDDGLVTDRPEGTDPAEDEDDGNNDQPAPGGTEPAEPEPEEDPDGDNIERPEADPDNGNDGQPGADPEENPENEAPEDDEEDGPAENVITLPAADDGSAEEKQELTVNFIDRRVETKDKTYDGKKHSISGFPIWTPQEAELTWTYTLTAEKLHDYYPEPGGPWTTTATLSYSNVEQDFAAAYEKIAPVGCGNYTLEISAEPKNPDNYKFDTDGLKEEFTFSILPLQTKDTELAGIAGITDKEYDGQFVDLVQCIRNAKVLTKSGVDITNEVNLEYRVEGMKKDGTEYSQTITSNTDSALLPVDAGSYTLYVSLVENDTKNYKAKEWKFPFTIGQRALTVAVNDQELHVKKGDPIEADTPLSPDDFEKALYELKGILDSEMDAFTEHLTVNVQQRVDTTETGVYDLAAAGINREEWPNYDISYTPGKLTVKARFKRVDNGGVLKAVTNVTNGLTLAEIAQQYLSKKTAVIYLADSKADEIYNDTVSSNDIRTTAQIEWDTEKPVPGTSYNEKEEREQKFKMQGKVILPELVYTDDDAKRTVTVEVSVREAYGDGQALMPRVDVTPGTVRPQTSVRLLTDEEGAQIYYTVDASDPRTSQTRRLYSEAIEINRTMTICATTHMFGKRDSEVLRATYFLDKTLTPGNPDDPDDPDNSTVPDEDVPKEDETGLPKDEDGIPMGMWVTDVKEYVYTGKAIKPEVRIYDYKKRLEEKKDYTISYKNNVNAADKKAAKAPTIVITGKGNYEGKLNKTFTIAPKNIEDPDVKTDDLTVVFNNKLQKPVPTITWNGRKLSSKKDYSIAAEAQIAVGNYPVTLTGTGNYTGVRKITFAIIADGTPVPKLTVSKIPAYTYTGVAITPKPTVKSGKELLEEGKDYTLTYEDNTEVGTAAVIITGTGASGRSKYFGVKRVTFQIKAAALMSKAKVVFDPAVYTGSAVEPACSVTLSLKVNGVTENRTLVRGTDYTVTYQNNVKVGTATAVFEGKGFYGGTLKKTYKINAYDLMTDPDRKVEIQTLAAYPYMKGGSVPKPVVRFNGKKLTEGVDYTLSYKNNKAAGSIATMTVKGKGNFKGSATRTYQVEVRDVSKEVQGLSGSEITVSASDKVYQAKANIYKTKIQVLDMNGKALTAGRDYDKNITYSYTEYTNVGTTDPSDTTARKAGDPVKPTDIIPANARIEVSVKAIEGSNYKGTVKGTYRFVRADLAKAKVTVPQQTYTGKAIKPKASDITVTLSGMVLSPDDFTVVGYSNNINKGTAKLTIQGNGNYGGRKTVSFKIKGKSLLSQIFG